MIKKILCYLRVLIILPGIQWNSKVFIQDLKRWKIICNIENNDVFSVALLLWDKPEYRNLFIYRNRERIFYKLLLKLIYPPLKTLYIETEKIGGGLFIQHGFATMISAKEIGENCWINQQVTIGYKGKGNPPTIGNNVTITCGAKVLGDIKVGDNSTIGANAVVIKDVDPGAVMVGIPATRIKANRG